jgi:drug/metabolite transporter (DMT)-like permease|tara:strand:- start:5125 stop:5586 length:462 start_codon:yes stop_codon:yes gene_type:complete
MYWISSAIISMLIIGFYNTVLQGTTNFVPDGLIYSHMYISMVLVIGGILSFVVLLYYRYTKPKEFKSMFEKKIKIKFLTIMIMGLFLILLEIFKLIAIIEGGSIATALINLNMYVTLIFGVFLFGEKFNYKMVISTIIATIAMIYTIYEKRKL